MVCRVRIGVAGSGGVMVAVEARDRLVAFADDVTSVLTLGVSARTPSCTCAG